VVFKLLYETVDAVLTHPWCLYTNHNPNITVAWYETNRIQIKHLIYDGFMPPKAGMQQENAEKRFPTKTVNQSHLAGLDFIIHRKLACLLHEGHEQKQYLQVAVGSSL
jgi:hypothetical protein